MLAFYIVPRGRLTPARTLVLIMGAMIALQLENLALGVIAGIGGDRFSGPIVASSYALNTVNPLRVGAAFVPLLVYWLVVDKSRLGKTDFFYVNTLFVNAATWLAVAGSAYLARFAIYTSMFLIIAIPKLVASLDRESRSILTVALVTFYGLFWYFDTVKDLTVYDFKWIFERP